MLSHLHLFAGEGQRSMSDLRRRERRRTTGGEAAVCTRAAKVSVQRPAAAVIRDEGEESCDWCRQAGGVGGGAGGGGEKYINERRHRA